MPPKDRCSAFRIVWTGDVGLFKKNSCDIVADPILPLVVAIITWANLLIVGLIVDIKANANAVTILSGVLLCTVVLAGTTQLTYKHKGLLSFIASFVVAILIQTKIIMRLRPWKAILHFIGHRVLESLFLALLLGGSFHTQLTEVSSNLSRPMLANQIALILALMRKSIPFVPYELITWYGGSIYLIICAIMLGVVKSNYMKESLKTEVVRMGGLIFFPMCVSALCNWLSFLSFAYDFPYQIISLENVYIIFSSGIILLFFLCVGLFFSVYSRVLPSRKFLSFFTILCGIISEIWLIVFTLSHENIIPITYGEQVPCPHQDFTPWELVDWKPK